MQYTSNNVDIRLPPEDFKVSRLQKGDRVKFLAFDCNEYTAIVINVDEPFGIIGQLFSGAILINTKVDFEKDVLKVLEVYREFPVINKSRKEDYMDYDGWQTWNDDPPTRPTRPREEPKGMKVKDLITSQMTVDIEVDAPFNLLRYDEAGMLYCTEYSEDVPCLESGDLSAYRDKNGLVWVLSTGDLEESGYIIQIQPGSCPIILGHKPMYLDEPVIVVVPRKNCGFTPMAMARIIENTDMLKEYCTACNFDTQTRMEISWAWFDPNFWTGEC